jgi:hypothetical protein
VVSLFRSCRLGIIVIASALIAPAAAAGPAIETPTAAEVERLMPEGTRLDGRALYDRFLRNRRRLRTVYLAGRILSSDPDGNPQQTNFWLQSKDYRGNREKARDGVFAKVLLKLTGPPEVRHTAYLYIDRDAPQDEQFMYSPSRKRTSRVLLRDQTVAGTDFSFGDFLVNVDDIEDAEYERRPNAVVQGVPCYVVDAFLKSTSPSQYSRSRTFLEQEHFVPLRTRYWDSAGVAVKELTSPHGSIKAFDGVWAPAELRMADLLERTRSVLHIDALVPNPELADADFTVSTLGPGS